MPLRPFYSPWAPAVQLSSPIRRASGLLIRYNSLCRWIILQGLRNLLITVSWLDRANCLAGVLDQLQRVRRISAGQWVVIINLSLVYLIIGPLFCLIAIMLMGLINCSDHGNGTACFEIFLCCLHLHRRWVSRYRYLDCFFPLSQTYLATRTLLSTKIMK